MERSNINRRRFLKDCALAAATPCLAATALKAAQMTPATRPGTHRIMSCNIRKPMPEDDQGGNGWPTRREMCVEIILAQRPDVICLQECQGSQFHYLKSRWPDFDSFALSNPEAVFTPTNAIFFSRARYAMISAGGFWFSEKPYVAGTIAWDSARVRFVNWVQLKARHAEQEFRVWNTHLDHLGQIAREKQAAMVVEAAEAFPKDYPQILTGDFNANGTNPAVKLVQERGWTDTYGAIHGPADPGFSFHAFWGPDYDAKAKKDRIRGKIDWIFCRGAVKPLASEILREGRNGHYPSDHYFVSVDVSL